MWKEYNPNPTGRRVEDCSVRAVAKALGITWEDAESGGGSYAMMGSYARGGQDGSYRGGRYSGYGMSYADRRGRGSDARRDSIGRYSSDGDLVHVLREMRDDVPDEKTRIEFDHFIRKMESM